MKMLLFMFASLGLASVLQAEMPVMPRIDPDSVRLVQDAQSRLVTVNYALEDAPGIVTVDFTTNGVSIGQGNLRSVEGQLNRLVQPGNYTLTWKPYESWPDHLIPTGGIKVVVTAWSTNSPPDYMVIDLTDNSADDRFRYYTCEESLPFSGGITNDLCKTDYLVMRRIHAAGKTFRMGITAAEKNGATINNSAPHYVQLTNDYYIGVYEFTQKQWNHLGTKIPMPKYFTVDWEMRPVTHVGGVWLRGYCDKAADKAWPRNGHAVNQTYGNAETAFYLLRKKLGGIPLDLPTEAQWEFAARAGQSGIMPDGSCRFDATAMGPYGRFPNSPDLPEGVTVTTTTPASDGGTAIVGSYPPNAWGLYDVLGNVAELCLDRWGKTYDATMTHINPVGAECTTGNDDKNRVIRGGYHGKVWSVATRNYGNVNYTDSNVAVYTGFRLCLTLP
ncbi:MAG: SUMF1/EgtB/PvdO family nonheme iron enzyme [Kiritimatiellae bacterium]|nr:SUMF1/EgtB/PvdO family nonheme iron enzyme [Kiritimatiellia bacterium]